ncbi:MAG: helix-turn-helix domain-containing protein [Acidimicrobiales bacterium]|nr:helix-turn-helix domain-containing protein [Acidimicrobiales bacterium]
MTNKKAPKSMLDLHLDVEGDTHVKVSLTRTPESTSFRLVTAESGHQSLPADLEHVDDIPADEPVCLPAPQTTDYLSVAQVAELLGYSDGWVRGKIRDGQIPAVSLRGAGGGRPGYAVAVDDVPYLAAEFGAEVSETKLRQMLGEPAGGGEVAPRAPASSSTLRLELIVETP